MDYFDYRERELDDEAGSFGDPRRCPHHGEVTSSPDGLFDAPCGACEGERDEADYEEPPACVPRWFDPEPRGCRSCTEVELPF